VAADPGASPAGGSLPSGDGPAEPAAVDGAASPPVEGAASAPVLALISRLPLLEDE
jgi:hypothetical protein